MPLLVPQDGVLVVKLQLLHRGGTAGLLSTTVPVFHHLKGLLHFSVPETWTRITQNYLQQNMYTAVFNQKQSLNSTYLRVSTCLEVAISEGNCVSLKISGGPWVGPRLVVVSRAPGGRYTPEGFDSGSSTSSGIIKITPV